MSAFLSCFCRFSLSIIVVLITVFSAAGQGQHDGHAVEKLNVSELIIHHVLDDHVWHFADGVVLHLPIVVYSAEKGLDVFSSANFYDEDHNIVPYNGYRLDHNNIYLEGSNKKVLDLSITKNVAMLFVNAALMLVVFLSVSNAYKRNKGKAPRGLQSFFEPIILFVRDEIVKPNIGHRYERYFPYLLTLFFFILFGNLLGLVPGAGNLTGNIAVTMVLAIITFIVTNVNGNRSYWSHIFWTPGLPLIMRFIILPVELIGIFTKPISLMVRLFVAITAGHIVLLSLIALTFVFTSYWVGLGSTLIVLFISLIEILVAAIQAYVFTLFSALYIGMATAEHEHH
jgi:F-type H+-transporting ATPase subunit a